MKINEPKNNFFSLKNPCFGDLIRNNLVIFDFERFSKVLIECIM
jgi:hypothetical protein